MILRPHTATVLRRLPVVVAGVEVGVSWEAAGPVSGQLEPRTGDADRQTAVWRSDLSADIRLGDRLLVGEVTWVVTGPGMRYDAWPPLDYHEWPLERRIA